MLPWVETENDLKEVANVVSQPTPGGRLCGSGEEFREDLRLKRQAVGLCRPCSGEDHGFHSLILP